LGNIFLKTEIKPFLKKQKILVYLRDKVDPNESKSFRDKAYTYLTPWDNRFSATAPWPGTSVNWPGGSLSCSIRLVPDRFIVFSHGMKLGISVASGKTGCRGDTEI
jgi:hypothetical protein